MALLANYIAVDWPCFRQLHCVFICKYNLNEKYVHRAYTPVRASNLQNFWNSNLHNLVTWGDRLRKKTRDTNMGTKVEKLTSGGGGNIRKIRWGGENIRNLSKNKTLKRVFRVCPIMAKQSAKSFKNKCWLSLLQESFFLSNESNTTKGQGSHRSSKRVKCWTITFTGVVAPL